MGSPFDIEACSTDVVGLLARRSLYAVRRTCLSPDLCTGSEAGYGRMVVEGKAVKNRLHLDVRFGTGLVGAERVAALEAACARLVALGAVRVRLLTADGYNESCLVTRNVEGNEFCLD
ncbi:VOC family protein [Salinispora tropica]|uniref:VOC family protein n=1 Tax=Salinispora tropica TaxID=168695 RepID=UPI00035C67E3|nr:VOC family protein [Salinispora tropica]